MEAFRLLDLPIETRLRIYHLFFAIKYRPTDRDFVKVDAQTNLRVVKPDIWPLFQVCKQIYSEVMPEYYASTKFHFNALVTLRETMKFYKQFNAYARHLVFHPNLVLPAVEDLLQLKGLHTFAVVNLNCHEPLGTPPGAALHHSTLRTALYRKGAAQSNSDLVQRVVDLYDTVAKHTDLHERDIHLLFRFGYSYVEKIKHPETWGGNSARRHRVLEYDLTDDIFVILQPDDNENPIIRNQIEAES